MKALFVLAAAMMLAASGAVSAQQRSAPRPFVPWTMDDDTHQAIKNALAQGPYKLVAPIIEFLDERENEAQGQAQMTARAKEAAANDARQRAASKALGGKAPPPIVVPAPSAPAPVTK